MELTLLDYGNDVKSRPFGPLIGKPRKLAWPVDVYRVTLPHSRGAKDVLNPFEQLILQLLTAVGPMQADELADETCIPVDLVHGILLRLQDKQHIDTYHQVIQEAGATGDGQTDRALSTPTVFVTVLLFREAVTEKLLPFLHILDDTNPLRQKEQDGYIRCLPRKKKTVPKPPQARDVISTLRAMQKRRSASGNDLWMPAMKQISIIPGPERYWLDCPIAIQASDGEFRIADPFGDGFSLILERAFEQALEQDDELAKWLSNWKESLRNANRVVQEDPQAPPEPFEQEDNSRRYPNLLASLRLPRSRRFRSLQGIYGAIEWAMFYVCCQHDVESSISQLKLTQLTQQAEMLASSAREIGLTLPRFPFHFIAEGKLRSFSDQKAELPTVLAIAIVQARRDRSHPLRRAATVFPDLIEQLLGIKKKRDEYGHGKHQHAATEHELPDDRFMRQLVHILLPSIVFADSPSVTNRDRLADAILDARAGIQSEFGFKIYHWLGAGVQDHLLQAERFWLSCCDHDNAAAFLFDLYAALQSLMRRYLADKLPPDLTDAVLVETARTQAQAIRSGDLPASLRTVKLASIRSTLQGQDPSLGACAMAFLLMVDDDTLDAVSNTQPTFIDDLAYITANRKHGNEALLLPREEIAALRKVAYNTIKTLSEI